MKTLRALSFIVLTLAAGGLFSCGRETFTGIDFKLTVSGRLTQVHVVSVRVDDKEVALANPADWLFPRTADRDLSTGDVFTLRFPDAEAGKPVQVSAQGLLDHVAATALVTTEQISLRAKEIVSVSLSLTNPAGTSGTGGRGNGGNGAMGGTGGSLGTGGSGQTGGASPGSGGIATAGGRGGNGGLPATGGTIGAGGRGGAATGGAATGGVATGGVATGGAATGGMGTGGRATGGMATGGSATGGIATGGMATGGVATGGMATGGAATGGTIMNGSSGCRKTPGISSSMYNNGQRISIMAAGMQRSYILSVPATYDSNRAYKLVLAFHQSSGTAEQIYSQKYFHLQPLDNDSTIFVAPNGQQSMADCPMGGTSCGWPNTDNTDLQLVDALVSQIEQSFCVDTERVFMVGWSYGASMAYKVACERPLHGVANGYVRAVAAYSAGVLSGACTPTKPVAYYTSHGTADTVLSYSTGVTMAQTFAAANGCTWTVPTKVTSGDHVCTDMTGCMSGEPVRFCSFNGDHTPDPKDSGQTTSWEYAAAWTFLSQF